MDRNLIKDEARKMRQDMVTTEIKKENFIFARTSKLTQRNFLQLQNSC